ncbi:MAG TPA: hypothetical protein PLN48_04765 [Lachnospiraceae bacterium]|nr:hypothetical protein [Lachnospiraceae bacterium]
MKTVALRFSNKFAPECGTIEAHNELIQKNGYVWYGKLGNKIAASVFLEILDNDNPRILLIHSGATNRYWAYIDQIQHEIPEKSDIPAYYRDDAEKFKTWFRVIRFENAPRDIMAKCTVASSGQELGIASKHSMSPYFKIIAPDYEK